jgi:hypothetical protein
MEICSLVQYAVAGWKCHCRVRLRKLTRKRKSLVPKMGVNLLGQVTGATFVLTMTTLHGTATTIVIQRNCGHTSASAASPSFQGVIAGNLHLGWAHSQTSAPSICFLTTLLPSCLHEYKPSVSQYPSCFILEARNENIVLHWT